MNPKEREEWKTTRANGFARFVLSKLTSAFYLCTVLTIGKLVAPLLTSRPKPPFSELVFYWIVSFSFFSIFGSIYAAVKWVRNEDKYFWGYVGEKREASRDALKL